MTESTKINGWRPYDPVKPETLTVSCEDDLLKIQIEKVLLQNFI
jgi:hypothetical protein